MRTPFLYFGRFGWIWLTWKIDHSKSFNEFFWADVAIRFSPSLDDSPILYALKVYHSFGHIHALESIAGGAKITVLQLTWVMHDLTTHSTHPSAHVLDALSASEATYFHTQPPQPREHLGLKSLTIRGI